jgi:hypothetical protein
MRQHVLVIVLAGMVGPALYGFSFGHRPRTFLA